MTNSRDLRKRAFGCRRAASIRTDGGGPADRELIALASRLELEADALDRMRRDAARSLGAAGTIADRGRT